MINDGSKDDTPVKIKKYMEQYPGFIRLIDKENGGHGSVINRGIDEAQGIYFKVVDGDDWVDTEGLYKLVSYLKTSTADLVLNPYISVGEVSGKKSMRCKLNLPHACVLHVNQVTEKGLDVKIHSATYKTDLLRTNGIRFSERCFYEDFEYANFPLIYVNTLTYLDFPVYNYLTEQKSQSVDDQTTYKNIDMFVKVYADSETFFSQHRSDLPAVNAFIHRRLMAFLRQTYNVFIKNYNAREIEKKIDSVDHAIKEISPDNYKEVGKRYPYIHLIRLKKRAILKGLYVLFRLVR